MNDYLLSPLKNTIFLKPADSVEIGNLILQLDESKATDVCGIPVKLIKLVQYTISEPLSMIFNQCLVSGTFPEKLKLAWVTKANSKLALTNYRPISVLPVTSKQEADRYISFCGPMRVPAIVLIQPSFKVK